MKLYINKYTVRVNPYNHFYNALLTGSCIEYKSMFKVDSTLHEKDNVLHTSTHFHSNIPLSLKTGTIRGELIRRVKICSTKREYIKHKNIYLNRLLRWGYSKKFIRINVKPVSYTHLTLPTTPYV